MLIKEILCKKKKRKRNDKKKSFVKIKHLENKKGNDGANGKMSHHLIEQKHKLSLVLISPLTFCVPHFIGVVQDAALAETGIDVINDHERRPQNCITRVELLRNCRN